MNSSVPLAFGDLIFFFTVKEDASYVLSSAQNCSAQVFLENSISVPAPSLFRYFGLNIWQILPCSTKDSRHTTNTFSSDTGDQTLAQQPYVQVEATMGDPLIYGMNVQIRSLYGSSYLSMSYGDFGGAISLSTQSRFSMFTILPASSSSQIGQTISSGDRLRLFSSVLQQDVSFVTTTHFSSEKSPRLHSIDVKTQIPRWKDEYIPILGQSDPFNWSIFRFGRLTNERVALLEVSTITGSQTALPGSLPYVQSHQLVQFQDLSLNSILSARKEPSFSVDFPPFASTLYRPGIFDDPVLIDKSLKASAETDTMTQKLILGSVLKKKGPLKNERSTQLLINTVQYFHRLGALSSLHHRVLYPESINDSEFHQPASTLSALTNTVKSTLNRVNPRTIPSSFTQIPYLNRVEKNKPQIISHQDVWMLEPCFHLTSTTGVEQFGIDPNSLPSPFPTFSSLLLSFSQIAGPINWGDCFLIRHFSTGLYLAALPLDVKILDVEKEVKKAEDIKRHEEILNSESGWLLSNKSDPNSKKASFSNIRIRLLPLPKIKAGSSFQQESDGISLPYPILKDQFPFLWKFIPINSCTPTDCPIRITEAINIVNAQTGFTLQHNTGSKNYEINLPIPELRKQVRTISALLDQRRDMKTAKIMPSISQSITSSILGTPSHGRAGSEKQSMKGLFKRAAGSIMDTVSQQKSKKTFEEKLIESYESSSHESQHITIDKNILIYLSPLPPDKESWKITPVSQNISITLCDSLQRMSTFTSLILNMETDLSLLFTRERTTLLTADQTIPEDESKQRFKSVYFPFAQLESFYSSFSDNLLDLFSSFSLELQPQSNQFYFELASFGASSHFLLESLQDILSSAGYISICSRCLAHIHTIHHVLHSPIFYPNEEPHAVHSPTHDLPFRILYQSAQSEAVLSAARQALTLTIRTLCLLVFKNRSGIDALLKSNLILIPELPDPLIGFTEIPHTSKSSTIGHARDILVSNARKVSINDDPASFKPRSLTILQLLSDLFLLDPENMIALYTCLFSVLPSLSTSVPPSIVNHLIQSVHKPFSFRIFSKTLPIFQRLPSKPAIQDHTSVHVAQPSPTTQNKGLKQALEEDLLAIEEHPEDDEGSPTADQPIPPFSRTGSDDNLLPSDNREVAPNSHFFQPTTIVSLSTGVNILRNLIRVLRFLTSLCSQALPNMVIFSTSVSVIPRVFTEHVSKVPVSKEELKLQQVSLNPSDQRVIQSGERLFRIMNDPSFSTNPTTSLNELAKKILVEKTNQFSSFTPPPKEAGPSTQFIPPEVVQSRANPQNQTMIGLFLFGKQADTLINVVDQWKKQLEDSTVPPKSQSPSHTSSVSSRSAQSVTKPSLRSKSAMKRSTLSPLLCSVTQLSMSSTPNQWSIPLYDPDSNIHTSLASNQIQHCSMFVTSLIGTVDIRTMCGLPNQIDNEINIPLPLEQIDDSKDDLVLRDIFALLPHFFVMSLRAMSALCLGQHVANINKVNELFPPHALLCLIRSYVIPAVIRTAAIDLFINSTILSPEHPPFSVPVVQLLRFDDVANPTSSLGKSGTPSLVIPSNTHLIQDEDSRNSLTLRDVTIAQFMGWLSGFMANLCCSEANTLISQTLGYTTDSQPHHATSPSRQKSPPDSEGLDQISLIHLFGRPVRISSTIDPNEEAILNQHGYFVGTHQSVDPDCLFNPTSRPPPKTEGHDARVSTDFVSTESSRQDLRSLFENILPPLTPPFHSLYPVSQGTLLLDESHPLSSLTKQTDKYKFAVDPVLAAHSASWLYETHVRPIIMKAILHSLFALISTGLLNPFETELSIGDGMSLFVILRPLLDTSDSTDHNIALFDQHLFLSREQSHSGPTQKMSKDDLLAQEKLEAEQQGRWFSSIANLQRIGDTIRSTPDSFNLFESSQLILASILLLIELSTRRIQTLNFWEMFKTYFIAHFSGHSVSDATSRYPQSGPESSQLSLMSPRRNSNWSIKSFPPLSKDDTNAVTLSFSSIANILSPSSCVSDDALFASYMSLSHRQVNRRHVMYFVSRIDSMHSIQSQLKTFVPVVVMKNDSPDSQFILVLTIIQALIQRPPSSHNLDRLMACIDHLYEMCQVSFTVGLQDTQPQPTVSGIRFAQQKRKSQNSPNIIEEGYIVPSVCDSSGPVADQALSDLPPQQRKEYERLVSLTEYLIPSVQLIASSLNDCQPTITRSSQFSFGAENETATSRFDEQRTLSSFSPIHLRLLKIISSTRLPFILLESLQQLPQLPQYKPLFRNIYIFLTAVAISFNQHNDTSFAIQCLSLVPTLLNQVAAHELPPTYLLLSLLGCESFRNQLPEYAITFLLDELTRALKERSKESGNRNRRRVFRLLAHLEQLKIFDKETAPPHEIGTPSLYGQLSLGGSPVNTPSILDAASSANTPTSSSVRGPRSLYGSESRPQSRSPFHPPPSQTHESKHVISPADAVDEVEQFIESQPISYLPLHNALTFGPALFSEILMTACGYPSHNLTPLAANAKPIQSHAQTTHNNLTELELFFTDSFEEEQVDDALEILWEMQQVGIIQASRFQDSDLGIHNPIPVLNCLHPPLPMSSSTTVISLSPTTKTKSTRQKKIDMVKAMASHLSSNPRPFSYEHETSPPRMAYWGITADPSTKVSDSVSKAVAACKLAHSIRQDLIQFGFMEDSLNVIGHYSQKSDLADSVTRTHHLLSSTVSHSFVMKFKTKQREGDISEYAMEPLVEERYENDMLDFDDLDHPTFPLTDEDKKHRELVLSILLSTLRHLSYFLRDMVTRLNFVISLCRSSFSSSFNLIREFVPFTDLCTLVIQHSSLLPFSVLHPACSLIGVVLSNSKLQNLLPIEQESTLSLARWASTKASQFSAALCDLLHLNSLSPLRLAVLESQTPDAITEPRKSRKPEEEQLDASVKKKGFKDQVGKWREAAITDRLYESVVPYHAFKDGQLVEADNEPLISNHKLRIEVLDEQLSSRMGLTRLFMTHEQQVSSPPSDASPGAPDLQSVRQLRRVSTSSPQASHRSFSTVNQKPKSRRIPHRNKAQVFRNALSGNPVQLDEEIVRDVLTEYRKNQWTKTRRFHQTTPFVSENPKIRVVYLQDQAMSQTTPIMDGMLGPRSPLDEPNADPFNIPDDNQNSVIHTVLLSTFAKHYFSITSSVIFNLILPLLTPTVKIFLPLITEHWISGGQDVYSYLCNEKLNEVLNHQNQLLRQDQATSAGPADESLTNDDEKQFQRLQIQTTASFSKTNKKSFFADDVNELLIDRDYEWTPHLIKQKEKLMNVQLVKILRVQRVSRRGNSNILRQLRKKPNVRIDASSMISLGASRQMKILYSNPQVMTVLSSKINQQTTRTLVGKAELSAMPIQRALRFCADCSANITKTSICLLYLGRMVLGQNPYAPYLTHEEEDKTYVGMDYYFSNQSGQFKDATDPDRISEPQPDNANGPVVEKEKNPLFLIPRRFAFEVLPHQATVFIDNSNSSPVKPRSLLFSPHRDSTSSTEMLPISATQTGGHRESVSSISTESVSSKRSFKDFFHDGPDDLKMPYLLPPSISSTLSSILTESASTVFPSSIAYMLKNVINLPFVRFPLEVEEKIIVYASLFAEATDTQNQTEPTQQIPAHHPDSQHRRSIKTVKSDRASLSISRHSISVSNKSYDFMINNQCETSWRQFVSVVSNEIQTFMELQNTGPQSMHHQLTLITSDMKRLTRYTAVLPIRMTISETPLALHILNTIASLITEQKSQLERDRLRVRLLETGCLKTILLHVSSSHLPSATAAIKTVFAIVGYGHESEFVGRERNPQLPPPTPENQAQPQPATKSPRKQPPQQTGKSPRTTPKVGKSPNQTPRRSLERSVTLTRSSSDSTRSLTSIDGMFNSLQFTIDDHKFTIRKDNRNYAIDDPPIPSIHSYAVHIISELMENNLFSFVEILKDVLEIEAGWLKQQHELNLLSKADTHLQTDDEEKGLSVEDEFGIMKNASIQALLLDYLDLNQVHSVRQPSPWGRKKELVGSFTSEQNQQYLYAGVEFIHMLLTGNNHMVQGLFGPNGIAKTIQKAKSKIANPVDTILESSLLTGEVDMVYEKHRIVQNKKQGQTDFLTINALEDNPRSITSSDLSGISSQATTDDFVRSVTTILSGPGSTDNPMNPQQLSQETGGPNQTVQITELDDTQYEDPSADTGNSQVPAIYGYAQPNRGALLSFTRHAEVNFIILFIVMLNAALPVRPRFGWTKTYNVSLISLLLSVLITLTAGPNTQNQRDFVQNGGLILLARVMQLPCDFEQPLLRFIRGYLAKHNEERHRLGVKLGNPLVSFQRQISRLLGETSSTGRVVEKNLDFGLDPKDIPDNTFSIIDCYEQYLLSVYDAGFQLRLYSSNSKEVKEAKQMLLDPNTGVVERTIMKKAAFLLQGILEGPERSSFYYVSAQSPVVNGLRRQLLSRQSVLKMFEDYDSSIIRVGIDVIKGVFSGLWASAKTATNLAKDAVQTTVKTVSSALVGEDEEEELSQKNLRKKDQEMKKQTKAKYLTPTLVDEGLQFYISAAKLINQTPENVSRLIKNFFSPLLFKRFKDNLVYAEILGWEDDQNFLTEIYFPLHPISHLMPNTRAKQIVEQTWEVMEGQRHDQFMKVLASQYRVDLRQERNKRIPLWFIIRFFSSRKLYYVFYIICALMSIIVVVFVLVDEFFVSATFQTIFYWVRFATFILTFVRYVIFIFAVNIRRTSEKWIKYVVEKENLIAGWTPEKMNIVKRGLVKLTCFFSWKHIITILLLIVAVIGTFVYPRLCCLLLIELFLESDVLKTIALSFSRNAKMFFATLFVLVIVLFLFAVLFFVVDVWNVHFVEEYNHTEEKMNHSILNMFLAQLWLQLSPGDHLGELMGRSWDAVIMAFIVFIFTGVMIMNILQGIIIDSFSVNRQKQDAVQDSMKTECLICSKHIEEFAELEMTSLQHSNTAQSSLSQLIGVGSDDTGKGVQLFERHIRHEHNPISYYHLYCTIMKTDPNNLTGTGRYLRLLFTHNELDSAKLFPINEAISLKPVVSEAEVRSRALSFFRDDQNEEKKEDSHLRQDASVVLLVKRRREMDEDTPVEAAVGEADDVSQREIQFNSSIITVHSFFDSIQLAQRDATNLASRVLLAKNSIAA